MGRGSKLGFEQPTGRWRALPERGGGSEGAEVEMDRVWGCSEEQGVPKGQTHQGDHKGMSY